MVGSTGKKYRRYGITMAAVMLLLALLVMGINVFIDPYGVWNMEGYTGLSRYHLHKETLERVNKMFDVKRQQPTTLLVGSSRTKFGLDPEDYVELTGNKRVYNLGINGPNIYMLRRVIEGAVRNSPEVNEIIMDIGFMMFNEANTVQEGFDDYQIDKTRITKGNFLKTTFSLDAVEASFESMALNHRERRDYDVRLPNGMGTDGQARNYHLWGKEKTLEFFMRSSKELATRVGYIKGYRYSESYFDNFRQIVELCRRRNIRLIVYVPPMHALQMESIDVCNEWQNFERWQRELSQTVEYYDFSGYNAVTTVNDYAANELYWDTSHYNSKVGRLILERILAGGGDDSFGYHVTADNIEQHLSKLRYEQQQWRQQNPQLAERVVLSKGFVDFEPLMLRERRQVPADAMIVLEDIMGKLPQNDIVVPKNGVINLSAWVAADKINMERMVAVLVSRENGKRYYAVCDNRVRADVANVLRVNRPLLVGCNLNSKLEDVPQGDYNLEMMLLNKDKAEFFSSGLYEYTVHVE